MRCKWCHLSESTPPPKIHISVASWNIVEMYSVYSYLTDFFGELGKHTLYISAHPVEGPLGAGASLSMHWVWVCVRIGGSHCEVLCSALRLKALYKSNVKHFEPIRRFIMLFLFIVYLLLDRANGPIRGNYGKPTCLILNKGHNEINNRTNKVGKKFK